jgi:hypothetical protein
MKCQKSCGPCLGKLVHQLPGVVTFAYDLRFRHVIACWKGIIEEINFWGSIILSGIMYNLYPEKPSFRPSKWPRKLKLLKIVNCQNCQKTILTSWKRWVATDIHLDQEITMIIHKNAHQQHMYPRETLYREKNPSK